MTPQKTETNIKTDVLIVGSGVAGLFCALNIPEEKSVMIISKGKLEDTNSYLARGGISVLKDDFDYRSFYEDTLKYGKFDNNPKAVDILIRSSQEVIDDISMYGVSFSKNSLNALEYTIAPGHSTPRILFHDDSIGEELTSKLIAEVRRRPNIQLEENVTMLDILVGQTPGSEERCCGIVAICKENSPLYLRSIETSTDGRYIVDIEAVEVVWASGGFGGLYERSTNNPTLTGDALGIALKHNIPVQNLDYIQIHPTTLYSRKPGPSFLISDTIRSAGGELLDKYGKRFTDENLPCEELTKAIFAQMKKDSTPYVNLSMAKIDIPVIKTRFRKTYERCLQEGIDCTRAYIPVVPSQHYCIGGVYTDLNGSTSMKSLYAVGECASTAVHGKNRLDGNSLLEALVFSKRAAKKITAELDSIKKTPVKLDKIDYSLYRDIPLVQDTYRLKTMNEIDRLKRTR